MMTSLMSIFDPSSSIFPHSMWGVLLFLTFSLKNLYWSSSSASLMVVSKLTSLLLKLFKTHSVIFISLFMVILNSNLMGLLPLVFSPTSHLSFNITLSLTIWLGMMIWYTKNNLEQFLTHLTPVGSPLMLAPVLVLIELVSSLIRPLTLGLRLMANIMAGHMILTLISKGVFVMPMMIKLPLFCVLSGFMMFEFGVALIQAYVFSSLMSLYWDESESH